MRFGYSFKIVGALLSLRQAIGFLITPLVQQLQRADLEIATQAYIKSNNILLVERRAVNAFKSCVVLVNQVGVHRACWPNLGATVADIDQVEFYTAVPQAFFAISSG